MSFLRLLLTTLGSLEVVSIIILGCCDTSKQRSKLASSVGSTVPAAPLLRNINPTDE